MGRGAIFNWQRSYLIDPLHRPVPLVVGARLQVRPEGFQAQRIRAPGDRLSHAVQRALPLVGRHGGDRVVEGEVEEDLGPRGGGHVGGRGERQIGENRRGTVLKPTFRPDIGRTSAGLVVLFQSDFGKGVVLYHRTEAHHVNRDYHRTESPQVSKRDYHRTEAHKYPNGITTGLGMSGGDGSGW